MIPQTPQTLQTRLAWMPLAVALIALSTTPVRADINVPSPALSTVPDVLVGDSNGMQILSGYRVVVRDATGATMAGSVVALHFAGTTRPYTSQVAPAQVTCPEIRNVTNAVGEVVFAARFGGYANAPAIQVSADGVILKTVLARSTDLNADGATNIIDLNLFRANFLFNPAAQETDFDQTGVTNIGDLSIFRQVYLNDIPGVLCP